MRLALGREGVGLLQEILEEVEDICNSCFGDLARKNLHESNRNCFQSEMNVLLQVNLMLISISITTCSIIYDSYKTGSISPPMS